jgi:hypothetical protein
MAADGAFSAEMPAHSPDPAAPHDDDTVERLLAGRLAPDEAPPAYVGVARVLRAAAGPPLPDELAGQATALAAFRAARRHRGRGRVRLVAAMVAGVLFAGGAATATGGLPAPVERVVRKVRGDAGVSAVDQAARRPRPPAHAPSATVAGSLVDPAPWARARVAGRAGKAAHDAKPGKPRKHKHRPAKPEKPKPKKPKAAADPGRH